VTRRSVRLATAGVLLLIVAGAVGRNQLKVFRNRQVAAEAVKEYERLVQQRRSLFEMLQPVALGNCRLERFGEPHDGGYLMCGNLLGAVESGYSYGISGYDKWGCDISEWLDVTVHQYDCFNATQPVCPRGRTVFHEECVGDTSAKLEGRLFDTIENQFTKNGDRRRRIVLKIDVEGAEWNSLLSTPDEVLAQIDQMAVEFHWLRDDADRWQQTDRYIRVVQRLKEFFEIAHIHYNNASCIGDLAPFPTWAYEVLFVSKRIAVVDRSASVGAPHPLDAPNNPAFPDCQPPVGDSSNPRAAVPTR
jgi:hypothetical protein